jgi:hypothetical protein
VTFYRAGDLISHLAGLPGWWLPAAGAAVIATAAACSRWLPRVFRQR